MIDETLPYTPWFGGVFGILNSGALKLSILLPYELKIKHKEFPIQIKGLQEEEMIALSWVGLKGN